MDARVEAIDFLKEKLEDTGPLNARSLAGYLSHTTESIRKTAGRNPDGVLDFVRSDPNTFLVSNDGTISLVPSKTTEDKAIQLLRKVLWEKEQMDIKNLVGYLSNVPLDVREKAGKNIQGVTAFLLEHPEVFHVSDDDRSVECTTSAFLDSLSEDLTCTDDEAIPLNVVDILMGHGVSNAPIQDLFQCLNSRLECSCTSHTCIANVKSILSESDLFHVNRSGQVTLKLDKLNAERILTMFMCAILEDKGLLSLGDLLIEVLQFKLATVLGVNTVFGLSEFVNQDTFVKFGNMVGLPGDSEIEALEFLYDILKRRGRYPIQKLTGYLSQASESVKDVIAGLTELRTLLIEHDDVFLVTDDDHVMIPDSEEVVRYFKEKLETKKEIALRNVHSFINNSPEEVKYFASHGTDRILQVLLSRKDTFLLTGSDTLTLTPNQPIPVRSSNSPEKLKSPTVSLTPKQPTPIPSSNSPEKLKSPTVSLTSKQPTPVRSSNSPEKLKSPTVSLTPKQPTPIRSSNSPEKLKSPTASSMKSTFKGTVKQLYAPYGTIRITEGKLLDQEVYFNSSGCIFAENGENLTECLSKGQVLRFYLQKGIPNGKYDWCAYNVEKMGSHVVSPSQQNGTVPDKSNKSVTPSKLVHGEVQLKILKHTTLLLLRREELSFADILLTLREIIPEGKKELASEASFVQILSNSELFQIGKKTVGLAVELSEGYVTTLQTDGGLIRESKHKNTVAFQKSAVYIPPETHVTNQLDYELKVNSSVKYIALPAHSKSVGFPHARAIIVWPSEGPNLKKLQSQLAASPGKSKAGAISGGASNAIASTPDKVLYGSTSSITSNTSTGSSSVVNEHLEILKEIVILLLSNGAMAIGNLYCALEKKLEGQSTTLVSTLEDLKKVLLRYDIFLVKIGCVVLKVRPSEGCISKNLMYSGFINNTSDKKDVFYRRTAVYVPPGDEQTKEKVMFNSKTRVKYIAVNVSSLPEKIHGNQIAPLRAVLVWPKDGTDPSKVKTPEFLACKMSPEKSMGTESDRSLHGSSSSLASSANSDSTNLINEHLEVLKGLVILLLSCGKMTVNQLHKAWEKTRTDAAKPMSASDLQKLIRQYDIFCIESEVVGLKAKPREGSISKIVGKNIGFINKTPDDNDVFFVKSALYIPFGQENMQSGMSVKENTIVRYIAVKVFSLPGKVTGNRICPYRGVLVWATDGPDPTEAKWGDMPTKERKASNEKGEPAPKESVEGTRSFSKGDRENPPDAESVQRLSECERNASHLRILKSAVLFLLTSECVSSLTEMWEFLKVTLPSIDLEQITCEPSLRQFLSKHTIFVVMGNTVALRYSDSKGYVSHVAGGNEAGFIGKTTKEKDIFFESAAVASSGKNSSFSLTKETRVNYIAVPESEMPYPWDHISGCPWRGILVWPEGSSLKVELTSHLPDTDAVTNLLDAETDLTCLVFIVYLLLLNKHGDNGISRLALAEEQGLPAAISDIFSHYGSCRRYVDSHSFLLKLDGDGETISLGCMPSNTAIGFHRDAKVVAVSNNSALAGSPKGRVYIARIGVFHCGDPGGTREVSRSKLKSALQVGDIVTCLTVPYQIPESVPTLPGADQSTLQAVLTWPSHYNHILETFCLQQKSEVKSCLKERTSSSLEEECIKIPTLGTEKRTILDVTGDKHKTEGPVGLGSGQSSHDEQQTAGPFGPGSRQSSHNKQRTAGPVGPGSGQSSHDKQQTAGPVGPGSGQSSHNKQQTAGPVGPGSGQSSHDKQQTVGPVALGSGQTSHGARGLERSPHNTGPTTENSSKDTKPFHQNAAVSQNHVGDQTWCRNIPEKPNPTILLTLIVACLKRKGILIEEAMDLLNRCVVLKNIRFSEDSFCLYLAHYNHVFEVLDDKIHLVGQFTPSKYIVKTSGTVVRIQNGQMFLKADSESCQTVTCPDRIFREVDCSDREVCVGDVIHFIATSYDHKSQLWEVLFAWPADVILESTEEFLLQIDSSSESGSCSTSGKHEVFPPSCVTKEGNSPISEISGKGTTGATDSFDEEERGLDSFSGNSQAKTKPEENTSFAPGHGKFQFLPQNDQLSVGSSDITGTHDKFDSGDVEYPQATEPSKSITPSESAGCLGNMPVGRDEHHSVEDVHDIPMEADIPSALNLTNSLNEITGNLLQSVTALVNTIESDEGGCWTEQGKKVKDILGSLLNARQELEHKRSHFQKMNSDVGEKPKQYIQQWLDKTETCGTAPDDSLSFDTCCSTTENLSNICHGETRSDPQKLCSDLDTTTLSFVTRNSEGKNVSRESFFTETSPKESFTDGELKSKLCQESKLDGIPLTVIIEDFPKGDVNYQGLPLQATVERLDKGCQADSTPVHSIQTQTSRTPVLNAASQTSSTGHVIITRYVHEKSGRSPSLPK